MLIYPDSLTDFNADVNGEFILYTPKPNKVDWDKRETRAASVLVRASISQVVDMGLPYGYEIDPAFANAPILHRSVVDDNVLWRTPIRFDFDPSKEGVQDDAWARILGAVPTLVDPNFFYNHTLIFFLDGEKLQLAALVHLSDGKLEPPEEVIAVATYFGFEYDT